jgi:hypothetical protein
MDHILYFASVRTQEGRALGDKLQPGMSFDQNYLATVFHGNTSKMVVFNFDPPGCLRVLDPQIDPLNKLLPPVLRDAAALSNPAMILVQNPVRLPDFYNPEIARGWCNAFSSAELARQQGNWQTAADIGFKAFKSGERANDPLENFVFIEAYAHTGNWEDARKLNRDTYKFSRDIMRPMLCVLWQRIEREAPASPQKDAAVMGAQSDLACEK